MISASALSQTPQKIFLAEHQQYNAEKQTRFNNDECEMLNVTWNGTQTYDFDGKPNDSDNDR